MVTIILGGGIMSDFNPQKLMVRFILPASPIEPLKGRKYTITQQNDNGQLILDIGTDFNYDVMNTKLEDVITIEWQTDWEYRLVGRVHVDHRNFTEDEAQKRSKYLIKQINDALQGIVFGDRLFLSNYPLLLDASIYILFVSTNPQYTKIYNFGTLKQYLKQFQYEI